MTEKSTTPKISDPQDVLAEAAFQLRIAGELLNGYAPVAAATCRGMAERCDEAAGFRCPGCSGRVETKVTPRDGGQIGLCERCGGSIADGISEAARLAFFPTEMIEHGREHGALTYFDVTYRLSPIGTRRVHGWMDRGSDRIVQIG